MKALVLDASVATKLYVREQDSDRAFALFDDDRFFSSRPMCSCRRSSTPCFDKDALARSIGHPIYDCLYIALAERWDTMFVTADLELEKKCAARAPELRRRRIALLGQDQL